MNQFFEFLSRYNRREQTILLVGALVVFVYLLWRAVLVPLQHRRSERIERNANVQRALGRVEVLSARLQEYRRSGTGNGQSGANLSRVIDTRLSAAGLAMSGFQPGTGGEARVRFDQVLYERIITWLHALDSRSGIDADD